MKEKPIIFSGPMVNAIRANSKTVTRRMNGLHKINARPGDFRYDGTNVRGDHLFRDVAGLISGHDPQDCTVIVKSQFEACMRLWVREAWRAVERKSDMFDGILFKADNEFVVIENTEEAAGNWGAAYNNGKYGENWRTPIFMPRWASRIDLQILNVRVERIQDITDDDIKREGVEGTRDEFAAGWDHLNAKRGYGWNVNPWVWRMEFKKAKG